MERGQTGKSEERLILSLEGISRHLPEIIENLLLARFLNTITGAAIFTPWNVGELPDTDIDELYQWRNLMRKSREFAGSNKEHDE